MFTSSLRRWSPIELGFIEVTTAAFSGLSTHWCQTLRSDEKVALPPMQLHRQCVRSSSSFLTGHRNLGITQDPRVLQAAQPISTRSFWSDALCWTAGVHTHRTSTTRGYCSPPEEEDWAAGPSLSRKFLDIFSSGNNIIFKKILEYNNLFNSFSGSL